MLTKKQKILIKRNIELGRFPLNLPCDYLNTIRNFYENDKRKRKLPLHENCQYLNRLIFDLVECGILEKSKEKFIPLIEKSQIDTFRYYTGGSGVFIWWSEKGWYVSTRSNKHNPKPYRRFSKHFQYASKKEKN